jgi:sarcosine oxidase subunit delta
MKILTCPVNGPRPIQEFLFGGELRELPGTADVTDEEWADHVFHRQGQPGVKVEWWYHLSSGTWFLAERDTATDLVNRTYLYGQEGERG